MTHMIASVDRDRYNSGAIRRAVAGELVRRCAMRVTLLRLILAYIIIAIIPLSAWAYRDYFTAEQKAQLDKIQIVLVDVIVLTDKGAGDAGPIAEVVARRLRELGYTTVQDPTKPHDAVF